MLAPFQISLGFLQQLLHSGETEMTHMTQMNIGLATGQLVLRHMFGFICICNTSRFDISLRPLSKGTGPGSRYGCCRHS